MEEQHRGIFVRGQRRKLKRERREKGKTVDFYYTPTLRKYHG
jgi:hypothetical protein